MYTKCMIVEGWLGWLRVNVGYICFSYDLWLTWVDCHLASVQYFAVLVPIYEMFLVMFYLSIEGVPLAKVIILTSMTQVKA